MQARFASIFALAAVAGCAGLLQIQPIATQFQQGAHSLVTTEESFFQAVKSADCNSQFYGAAAAYALGNGPSPGLGRACTPTILTDKEIAIRKALLDAISVYADRIQALATGTNAALDTGAKTMAADLNKRFSKPEKPVAAGVESAIIELANIALDARRFAGIKGAAAAASPPLAIAVGLLKTENTAFSAGIDSKIGSVEISLNTILRTEHGARAFFDVAMARSILAAANPFSGAAAQGAAEQSADSMAQKLNAALDALLKANTALATAESSVPAAVSELVARAKDAETLYAALNK